MKPLLISRYFIIICACFANAGLLGGCGSTRSIEERLPVKQSASKRVDYQLLNEGKPGESVDFKRHLVYGKYTIVEFFSPYCGPCMEIGESMRQLPASRRDIAVRSIDINRPGVEGIDWKSPAATSAGVRSVPHFKIYGPDLALIAEGRPAFEQVMKLLHDEFDD